MAGDREAAETSTYYALLDIVGEKAARRIEASDSYGDLVDDLEAWRRAGHDADELTELLVARVRNL